MLSIPADVFFKRTASTVAAVNRIHIWNAVAQYYVIVRNGHVLLAAVVKTMLQLNSCSKIYGNFIAQLFAE